MKKERRIQKRRKQLIFRKLSKQRRLEKNKGRICPKF
jgi:hypothetical protein